MIFSFTYSERMADSFDMEEHKQIEPGIQKSMVMNESILDSREEVPHKNENASRPD